MKYRIDAIPIQGLFKAARPQDSWRHSHGRAVPIRLFARCFRVGNGDVGTGPEGR
jgi:hypothetical protein